MNPFAVQVSVQRTRDDWESRSSHVSSGANGDDCHCAPKATRADISSTNLPSP